jgi:hypothetical protein
MFPRHALVAVLFSVSLMRFVDARLHAAEQEGWNVTASTLPPGGEAFFGDSPQGVANGPAENSLVFSGRHLLRYAAVRANNNSQYNFTTLAINADPIPHVLQAQGYDHIGDVDTVPYALATLLAPIEEPSYTRPLIAVYNVSDSNISYVRSAVLSQHHSPWVAYAQLSLTGGTDAVLSSEYDNVVKVMCYSWPELTFLYPYNLQRVGANGLMRVQGGFVTSQLELVLSTDQNANPEGHDLFVFDLVAIVHAEQPFAPLKHSQKSNWSSPLTETEGLTIDAEYRLWVVTNLLGMAPLVYTLQ